MTDQTIDRPHSAIISVQLEVHSLLDTGECSGQIVNDDTLSKYNIESAFIIPVSGFTLDDCLTKLQKKIEDLKNEPKE